MVGYLMALYSDYKAGERNEGERGRGERRSRQKKIMGLLIVAIENTKNV